MTVLRSLFLSLICTCLPLPVTADSERVQRFFDDLHSLEADFRQQVTNDDQGVGQDSSGQVWIQRPGLFRWHYQQPFEQELIADGRNLWTYDPDLEQVTVKPVTEVLSDSPAMLLSGTRALGDLFDISPMPSVAGIDWFRLEPKSNDGTVEQIQLGFDGAELRLMQVLDGFGNRTRLEFDAIKRNGELAPDLFAFTPPPGTDVIGSPR